MAVGEKTALGRTWFVIVSSPDEFEEAQEHFRRTLEEAQLNGEEVMIRVKRIKKLLNGVGSSKSSHG